MTKSMSHLRVTFQSLYKDALKEEQLFLQEGLIQSYPILSFKLAVLKQFKPSIIHIGVVKSFNVDTSLLIVLKNKDTLESIKKLADTYGYHLGFKKNVIVKGQECESYQFDPKYPTIVPQKYLPEYGYHITLNKNLNNILRIGLTPKNSKTAFEHPGNRIYILFAQSKEAILQTKKIIKHHLIQKGLEDAKLSVLRVSINKSVTHYFDPNLQPYDIHKDCFGVFVLRNIHPGFLEIIPELSDNE